MVNSKPFILLSNFIAFLVGLQTGRSSSIFDCAAVSDVANNSPRNNNSVKNTTQAATLLGHTPVEHVLAHDEFCNTNIINEQQSWNTRKKVIAYSLFANDEGVLKLWLIDGLKYNVEGAALYYPDWVVRVYVHGDEELIEKVLNVSSNTAEVVKCRLRSQLTISNSRKRMARFLAYDDPKVELMIARDLDSRFSPREMFAVHQWISSNYMFHVMRDHERHHEFVMAGMFGMKRGTLASTTTMTELVQKACQDYPSSNIPTPIPPWKGDDQVFLGKYVWPLVRNSTLAHDDNVKRCKSLSKGKAHCTSWPMAGPTSIKNNYFVGAPFKKQNATQYYCNVRCKTEPF